MTSLQTTIKRWFSLSYCGKLTFEEGDQEVGIIPIDAIYSPVTRVRYKTEETRVGQRVNYDRLILEVWTRGTILPEDAVVEAAKILRKHLNPFVMYHLLGEQVVGDGIVIVRTDRKVSLLEQYGEFQIIDRRRWGTMAVTILQKTNE